MPLRRVTRHAPEELPVCDGSAGMRRKSPALPGKLRDAAPYAAVDMHGRALNRRCKIKNWKCGRK